MMMMTMIVVTTIVTVVWLTDVLSLAFKVFVISCDLKST